MKSLKTKFKTTVALALALIMIPATAFAAEEGFETGNSQKTVQVTVNGPQLQYKVTLPLSVTMKDVNDLTEDEVNEISAIDSKMYTNLKNASFGYFGSVPLSVEGNIGTKKISINFETFSILGVLQNVDTGTFLYEDYESINGGATDLDYFMRIGVDNVGGDILEITASEVAAGYSNSYACMFHIKPDGEGRVMPAGNYSGEYTISFNLVDAN